MPAREKRKIMEQNLGIKQYGMRNILERQSSLFPSEVT
jgi:hypothetical protein